ncbi:cellulase [Ascobolus immersus RN42]|uniref:Glucanase n=1 Tax=Ascobolus immersus RN42 TaxID=1160509 RepID=A0A3N4IA33_ASCIM|nr:cellulase [Ascobolus immersus RN42]
MRYAFAAAGLLAVANAQVQMWGQCGGIGHTGGTTCVSGATCTKLNDYYSQCLPGQSSSSTTTTPTTTSTTTTPRPSTTTPTTTVVVPTTTPRPTTLTTVTSTTGTPTTSSQYGDGTPTNTGTKGPVVTVTGNPFIGHEIYANPYYASQIQTAVASLQTSEPALAAKAASVAKIGTFLWLDVVRKVPYLKNYLDDIRYQQAQGRKVIAPIVVYDLPDRDCAALASNGEFAIADGGEAKYKDYINQIAAIIKEYNDINTVLVIEPDSVANMITNMGVPKCAGAAKAYREGIQYALKTLNFPHVSMYIDAGHAGWLGWPANITPAAKEYSDLFKNAGSPRACRGIATNVSNYNAWIASSPDPATTPNPNYDEKHYVDAFAPMLEAAGFPAHFIVDTGRSGVQNIRAKWGDWCNVKGAGFGIRPTTNTGHSAVDALVWIKPGGESDGTSDQSAVRFDAHCRSESSHIPAPEAGQWFNEFFITLVKNANPPL